VYVFCSFINIYPRVGFFYFDDGGVSRIKLIVVLDNFTVGGGGTCTNNFCFPPGAHSHVSTLSLPNNKLVRANKLDRRDGFGCENAGRTCRSQYICRWDGTHL
jgi:hypothetical protein